MLLRPSWFFGEVKSVKLLAGSEGLAERVLGCCVSLKITLSTRSGGSSAREPHCCRWSRRFSICWHSLSATPIG